MGKDHTVKVSVKVKEELALIRRVSGGKATAEDFAAARVLIESKPDIWGKLGDLMDHARGAFLREMNMDEFTRQCAIFRAETMARDLGIEQAGPLDKMLIEHVVLCWLRLGLIELQYTSTMSQSVTLTLGIYMEKRLSAAQKRYTRACESLAKVRRLQSRNPLFNVSVGQVNGGANIAQIALGALVDGLRKGQTAIKEQREVDAMLSEIQPQIKGADTIAESAM